MKILVAREDAKLGIMDFATDAFKGFGARTFTAGRRYPTFNETINQLEVIDDRGETQTLTNDFIPTLFEVVHE